MKKIEKTRNSSIKKIRATKMKLNLCLAMEVEDNLDISQSIIIILLMTLLYEKSITVITSLQRVTGG